MFLTVTVTPGSTDPVWSNAVPVMVPVVSCADAAIASAATSITESASLRMLASSGKRAYCVALRIGKVDGDSVRAAPLLYEVAAGVWQTEVTCPCEIGERSCVIALNAVAALVHQPRVRAGAGESSRAGCVEPRDSPIGQSTRALTAEVGEAGALATRHP